MWFTVHVPPRCATAQRIPMLVAGSSSAMRPIRPAGVRRRDEALSSTTGRQMCANWRLRERAVALGNGKTIDLGDLPPAIAALPDSPRDGSQDSPSGDASLPHEAVGRPPSPQPLQPISKILNGPQSQRVFEQVKGIKLCRTLLGISRGTLPQAEALQHQHLGIRRQALLAVIHRASRSSRYPEQRPTLIV